MSCEEMTGQQSPVHYVEPLHLAVVVEVHYKHSCSNEECEARKGSSAGDNLPCMSFSSIVCDRRVFHSCPFLEPNFGNFCCQLSHMERETIYPYHCPPLMTRLTFVQ